MKLTLEWASRVCSVGVRYAAQLVVIGCFIALGAQFAGAQVNPCANVSVGSDHGQCAVLIDIEASGSGPMATIHVNEGVGPYDGVEDIIVGVVNNSGVSVTSITLTGTDIFGFDQDGPCGYPNGGTQNCYNGGQFHISPGDYQGPNNTFSNISRNHNSGTVNFVTPLSGDSGNTWFALEGQPTDITGVAVGTTQVGDPINPNSPDNLTQMFTQNGTSGQQVAFAFDFLTAFDNPNSGFTVQSGTTPFVGFSGVNRLQWPALVAGTALGDTMCLAAKGLTDSGGNPLCVFTSLTATTTANPTASGANLPQSQNRDLVLTQTLDLDTAQGAPVNGDGNGSFWITVPQDTAPGMAEFNDTGACPFESGDPLFNTECPRSILTGIEDGSTKPAGTPRPAGSSQVLFCCEPEWVTTPTVPQWSRTTSIPVSFVSQPPTGSANFTPSFPMGVLFGAVPQSAPALDPKLPNFPGQQTSATNPATTCPVAPNDGTVWNTNPTVFSSTGTLMQYTNVNSDGSAGSAQGLGEGAYNLVYAFEDCDEFIGLKYPSTIPVVGNEIPGNLAAWYTQPFNIDQTNPTVSAITLSPAGGYYAQNSTVSASFSCTDPTSNSVQSGIATCGPNAGGGSQTVNVTNAPVTTSAVGSFNYTAGATDVAGNSATQVSVPYQVVGQADLSMAMIAALSVKKGQNVTYLIGVVNGGPSTAYNVSVTDMLPSNATFVSAGYAVESCSFSGVPSCSLTPPKMSCGGPTCNIGTLPAWTKKNPIGVLIQVTLTAGTTSPIKNTATVSGVPGADLNPKYNSASWSTQVK